MIKTIHLILEYNTYCIWLYDENNQVIDNDNPPEWDDAELTEAFMKVSDLYDTFFVNNQKEFRYVGCPDEKTRQSLINLLENAIKILEKTNQGKYPIINNIDYNF